MSAQPPPQQPYPNAYPPPPEGYRFVPPPPPQKGMSGCALAAIITGAVFFFLVGPMAVLAIYGVRKYIANAKTAEARYSLGEMARDASVEYESDSLDDQILKPGAPLAATHHLCASASRSVPASATAIQGRKYQSSASDWQVDAPQHAGFACLKFSLDAPQYFMYSYAATGTSFTGTANGDLNGDGVLSTFQIQGQIAGGTLNVAPSIQETNPQE
jgi:type IV pilus assembly protein PilA